MRITSIGTFQLDGIEATVTDPRVTDSAVILITPQNAVGQNTGGWDGFHGIAGREPGHSFTFRAARPGFGVTIGYAIFDRVT